MEYEVVIIETKEFIMSGSEQDCCEYVMEQEDWYMYEVRPKTNEKIVSDDAWSGGFASNH